MRCTKTQESGGPEGPPSGLSIPPEVERHAREDVTAERVVDLRPGIAVARAGRAVRLTGQRRLRVEKIVDAEPEVEVIPDPEIRRQVDIVHGSQAQVLGPLIARRIQVGVVAE